MTANKDKGVTTIMGMTCKKCLKKLNGCLMLPDPHTTEEIAGFLANNGIYPECQACIMSGPAYITLAEAEEAK